MECEIFEEKTSSDLLFPLTKRHCCTIETSFLEGLTRVSLSLFYSATLPYMSPTLKKKVIKDCGIRPVIQKPHLAFPGRLLSPWPLKWRVGIKIALLQRGTGMVFFQYTLGLVQGVGHCCAHCYVVKHTDCGKRLLAIPHFPIPPPVRKQLWGPLI